MNKLTRGAAGVVMFGLVWFSPLQALAQPLPGSLVVTITSPTSGSTVAATITVSASVGPAGALVAGVQFKLDEADLGVEDTAAPYSVPWDTTTTSNGSHTLTAVARDAAGDLFVSDPVTITVSNTSPPPPATFAAGDLFLSFEKGIVQWRGPDGTLKAELTGTVPGNTEGIRFDAAGNLYVTRWCADPDCTTGNTVEKFNVHGVSEGSVGTGYHCNPGAITFDAVGNMYVGQADCSGQILKIAAGRPSVAYQVAAERRGSLWVDLASDGCTIFYTSLGPNVKRFDVCTTTQLPDFNLAPLPGGETHALHVLPDGGVLVSTGQVVSRLDAGGALVQTYSVSGESQYWTGVDLVGDGTFWAVNYYASNVYKFDLATGAVLASFNTGPPVQTVDVRVSPGAPR